MPKKMTTYSDFSDKYNMEISKISLKEACIRVFEREGEGNNDASITFSKADLGEIIKTLTDLEKDLQS